MPRLPGPVGEALADDQGPRVLGAQDTLDDGQQRGQLVAGPGRIPRLPGPVGEVGSDAQGVVVLGAQNPLVDEQQGRELVAGPEPHPPPPRSTRRGRCGCPGCPGPQARRRHFPCTRRRSARTDPGLPRSCRCTRGTPRSAVVSLSGVNARLDQLSLGYEQYDVHLCRLEPSGCRIPCAVSPTRP